MKDSYIQYVYIGSATWCCNNHTAHRFIIYKYLQWDTAADEFRIAQSLVGLWKSIRAFDWSSDFFDSCRLYSQYCNHWFEIGWVSFFFNNS